MKYSSWTGLWDLDWTLSFELGWTLQFALVILEFVDFEVGVWTLVCNLDY